MLVPFRGCLAAGMVWVKPTKSRKELRHDRILSAFGANPSLRVNRLAEELGVSTETIRRDLAELDRVGRLSRTYGGAVSTGNNYPNQAWLADGQGVRRDLPLNFFMDRYTESYITEMREFVEAVLEDKSVPVTGQDGRAPVVMGLAARRSYDEGRPVRLAEIVA